MGTEWLVVVVVLVLVVVVVVREEVLDGLRGGQQRSPPCIPFSGVLLCKGGRATVPEVDSIALPSATVPTRISSFPSPLLSLPPSSFPPISSSPFPTSSGDIKIRITSITTTFVFGNRLNRRAIASSSAPLFRFAIVSTRLAAAFSSVYHSSN